LRDVGRAIIEGVDVPIRRVDAHHGWAGAGGEGRASQRRERAEVGIDGVDGYAVDLGYEQKPAQGINAGCSSSRYRLRVSGNRGEGARGRINRECGNASGRRVSRRGHAVVRWVGYRSDAGVTILYGPVSVTKGDPGTKPPELFTEYTDITPLTGATTPL